ncbi:hypothetical protein BASA50_005381 [Batrachochytrium salamandrivorans]|uniref:Uncharacterized protein n=1 Tax=Batrachochytrium salamandrivorans TaxID=1357716 RepID=A0ABQ8FDB2_9FUNG|nr:hypothetical protein BASA62_005483 [Batrachochytrium salamandrivorans]KAH6571179.1 hypothetical protein BASA60_007300 [Batrachochytrium salamandrivorans]KAH6596084.1 hypothetical protein BASA50_005381 [Batrachochytrium salamandrivorans]
MSSKSGQASLITGANELSHEELSKMVFDAVRSGDALLLGKACANKSHPAVHILMSHADCHDSSALLISVSGAHLEVTQLLLKMGANANDKNAYGWSPLMLAALNGDFPHVKLLLHHGAQIDTTSDLGLTALTCAVRAGNLQVVHLLVESGANVNLVGGMTGLTSLMIAANSGSDGIVSLLLNNGAECNAQSKINGWTALMYAVNTMTHKEPVTKKWLSRNEHWEGSDTVRTLLEFGADIDIQNWTNQKAADVAFTNGKEHGDVFNRLCKEGRSRSGQSPQSSELPNISTKQGWFSRLTGEFGGTRERVQGLSLDDPRRSPTRTIRGSRWTQACEDPGVIVSSYSAQLSSPSRAGSMARMAPNSTQNLEISSEITKLDTHPYDDSTDYNSYLSPAIPKRPKNLEIRSERTRRAGTTTYVETSTSTHT